MVINAELKPGEYDIGRTSHCIIHVISRGPSIMNFHEDARIEHESICKHHRIITLQYHKFKTSSNQLQIWISNHNVMQEMLSQCNNYCEPGLSADICN